MLVTVIITIATHNLAAGVVAGVLLSGVFFTFKVANMLQVRGSLNEAGDLYTWTVSGQVFCLCRCADRGLRRACRSWQAGPHRCQRRAFLGHHRRGRAGQGHGASAPAWLPRGLKGLDDASQRLIERIRV